MTTYTYGMYDPSTMTPQQWEARRVRRDTAHWVRLSAELGKWLEPHTGRDDIIVVVEPGTADGNPACYIPTTATIHINPDICVPSTDPADIHLDTAAGRSTHAALTGAARHEAGHAAYTHWEINQTPAARRLMETALLLEEPAMERDVVAADPTARPHLRASFHALINNNHDPQTVAAAAHVACLVHGRVDAGVLTAEEVQPVIDLCTTIIGDRYHTLRRIWLDVQQLPTPRTDTTIMTRHAQRWLDTLGDDAPPTPPTNGTTVIVCGHNPNNNGDSDGDDGDGGGGVLAETVAAVTADAEQENTDNARTEHNTAEAETRAAAAASNRENTRQAEKVFTLYQQRSGGNNDEQLAGTRPPNGTERAQAAGLVASLRAAQYRDRATTTTGSVVPPGRYRAREAMKRSAEQALGLPLTGEPFQRRVRRHIPEPPLTIGIGCDISGSMQWAAPQIASVAWVVADAVHQIDGDTATVAYGRRVHPVVAPRTTPTHVQLFNATAGTENFTDAVRALNGALGLLHNPGARLLIIVSDGHYTATQRNQGQTLIDELLTAGVGVVQLGFRGTGRHTGQPDKPFRGVQYIRIVDPTKMGATIGGVMVKALNKA